MAATARRKFTPSIRPKREAAIRDLMVARAGKRPKGLIWHLACSFEVHHLNDLKRRLQGALRNKADGLAYRAARLRGGMTRTWDDLIALLKGDIRMRLSHMRTLQGLAASNGFRLPG